MFLFICLPGDNEHCQQYSLKRTPRLSITWHITRQLTGFYYSSSDVHRSTSFIRFIHQSFNSIDPPPIPSLPPFVQKHQQIIITSRLRCYPFNVNWCLIRSCPKSDNDLLMIVAFQHTAFYNHASVKLRHFFNWNGSNLLDRFDVNDISMEDGVGYSHLKYRWNRMVE